MRRIVRHLVLRMMYRVSLCKQFRNLATSGCWDNIDSSAVTPETTLRTDRYWRIESDVRLYRSALQCCHRQ